MGYNNWKWQYACGDFYEPLASVKGWKKCRQCGEFPRVWIFDNGNHAKCCCAEMYGPHSASAPSIVERMNTSRGSMAGPTSLEILREAWNKTVMEQTT